MKTREEIQNAVDGLIEARRYYGPSEAEAAYLDALDWVLGG